MYRSFLRAFGKSVEIIDSWAMVLCVVLLAVVVGLNAVEIFTRYFLGYSSPISMELAVSLSSVMYFLGYTVLFKRDEDVVMRFFFDRLGPISQRLIATTTHLAVLVFFIVLVKKSTDLYNITSVMMHPVFSVKQSYTVLPVITGSILALWVSIYKTWSNLDDMIRWWAGSRKSQN